ncbi:tetratricopeptide repeat protein [candidate division KSB1 bacterium]|nr:tetratricopeptide repeat protein [candidate division KSB1 bacterium]
MIKPCSFVVILFAVSLCSGCNSKPEESLERMARSDFLARQGEEALRQNEFDFALMFADSAEKLAPKSANVHFLHARIYSELGQWQKTETAYLQALKLEPGYRGAWNNLGNNAYRQQKYHQAIAFYQRELKTNPAPIPWRGMGRAYEELGKADSARYAFQRAITIDSLYAPAHFSLAQLYDNEGEVEKALYHAQRAWQLEPGNLEYRYLVGSLLVKTKQYERALGILREVIEKWPWYRGAQYNFGQALVHLGRQVEAKKYLDEAERVRAVGAQIEHLENSVRSLPHDPMVHASLAFALRRVGRYNDAMHAYKVAAHLAPNNMEIQNNIANLHLIKGDTTRAINQYHMILQHDSTLVDIWLNLGIVYALSRQIENARRAWLNALKHQPNHPAARAYLAKLPSAR